MISLLMLLGCTTTAQTIVKGVNPFAGGSIVFTGKLQIYLMMPTKIVETGNLNPGANYYGKTITRIATGNPVIKFYSVDGNMIDCKTDTLFTCVLPPGRYNHAMIFGVGMASISQKLTGKFFLDHYIQWLRIENHETAAGNVNSLGDIVIEVYPDISHPTRVAVGNDTYAAPVLNFSADSLEAAPSLNRDVTLEITKEQGTFIETDRRAIEELNFTKSGILVRKQSLEQVDELQLLAQAPTGTSLRPTAWVHWSRPCLAPGVILTAKPSCGIAFLRPDFRNAPIAERFD